MPYPNEHAARIKNPSQYKSFARQKIANGISLILGIKEGGGSESQAYRFKKTLFTAEQAKKWLKDHDIKYISFEAAREIQAFNIALQCLRLNTISQEEIIKNIDQFTLEKIKQKDAHPFFTAYSIAHEGISSPNILNEENKPISWVRKAIQSIKRVFKNGIKFFNRHNADNSTEGREPLGEVVGSFQKEIDGNLNHIVIGYHPPDKVDIVKNCDICSQEGVWNLIDIGKQFIAEKLEEITAIALGNSAEEMPAFAGAKRLGIMQAFENNNPGRKEIKMAIEYQDLLSVDVKTLQRVVAERAFWPNQLFGNDYDMRHDRVFGKVYDELEKANQTISQWEAKYKQLEGENTTYKQEKEKAIRKNHEATAKQRLDEMIKTLPEGLKKYIPIGLNLETMPDLSDESLQRIVDEKSENYKQLKAAGLLTEKTETGNQGAGGGNPADKENQGGEGGETDFTSPEVNPLLKEE